MGITPGLVASLSAGLQVAVRPLVHLVLELAGEWGRVPPGLSPPAYQRDAAQSRALRLALGVSFAY